MTTKKIAALVRDPAPSGGFTPAAWRDLERVGEERLRAEKRLRAIVLAKIRRRIHPSQEDVAAALVERPPDPASIARVPLTPKEREQLKEVMLNRQTRDAVSAWVKEHITEDRRRAAIEAARGQIASDTAALCEYVARYYVRSTARKPGPKTPRRTFAEERAIAGAYFLALDGARGRQTRAAVMRRVADRFGISQRTLQRIVKGLRAKVS